MMGLITGYWVSQAIGVVARLGVPDQLAAGPRTSDDLAQAVGAQPRALARVLRMLASIDVFTEPTPSTIPTRPRATSAVRRPNPERSAHPEPERPKSSSMTVTCSRAQPNWQAFSTRAYWRAVDSRWFSTWAGLDWRM